MRVVWEQYHPQTPGKAHSDNGCANSWWDMDYVITSMDGIPQQHCRCCGTLLAQRLP